MNKLLRTIVCTVLAVLLLMPITHASFLDSIDGFISDTGDTALYSGYRSYMYWISGGVQGGSRNRLKPDLVNLLKPYYTYDLRDVKFAFTTRLDDLAMSDCRQIYFGDRIIVRKLKGGEKLSAGEFTWLAHELTHGQQCAKIGGRKKYALRWFGEAGSTVMRQIARGNFAALAGNILNAQKLARYDDEMAMEEHATRHSKEVYDAAFPRQ